MQVGLCFAYFAVLLLETTSLCFWPARNSLIPYLVDPDDEYDVARQGMVSHHWYLVDGEWQQWSVPFRYVWPAELDLMARLAGMTLEHRWADWDRTPFTGASTSHVSIWRKPAG